MIQNEADKRQYVQDLMAFLDASPTSFHAVAAAEKLLSDAGFQQLREDESWSLKPGQAYFVTRGGGSLIAWRLPEELKLPAFRILGAHTDAPGLRLKPQPADSKRRVVRLETEVYGGPILATWLDRDLIPAGRVVVRRGGEFHSHLVRLDRIRLHIPNVAIHLNREVNKEGLKVNEEEHLRALLGVIQHKVDDANELLINEIAKALEVDVSQIMEFDMFLADAQPAALGGAEEEFLYSGRLDNQAMTFAAIWAIKQAADVSRIPVAAVFDGEEIGSRSESGAFSSFLEACLRRIAGAFRVDSTEDWYRGLAGSWMVSADGAHAWHPNYPGKYSERHAPEFFGGPAVKWNANRRYGSTAPPAALFQALCREGEIPCQRYVNRADLPCGSTIGPIVAARLGIPVVDVGAPMLSMHSIREMTTGYDQYLTALSFKRFFEPKLTTPG